MSLYHHYFFLVVVGVPVAGQLRGGGPGVGARSSGWGWWCSGRGMAGGRSGLTMWACDGDGEAQDPGLRIAGKLDTICHFILGLLIYIPLIVRADCTQGSGAAGDTCLHTRLSKVRVMASVSLLSPLLFMLSMLCLNIPTSSWLTASLVCPVPTLYPVTAPWC